TQVFRRAFASLVAGCQLERLKARLWTPAAKRKLSSMVFGITWRSASTRIGATPPNGGTTANTTHTRSTIATDPIPKPNGKLSRRFARRISKRSPGFTRRLPVQKDRKAALKPKHSDRDRIDSSRVAVAARCSPPTQITVPRERAATEALSFPPARCHFSMEIASTAKTRLDRSNF